MNMGNYLYCGDLLGDEMATREKAPTGVDHLTVVPANFDPDDEDCPTCGRPLSEH